MFRSLGPHVLHASALHHPATLLIRFDPLVDLPSTFVTLIILDERKHNWFDFLCRLLALLEKPVAGQLAHVEDFGSE